MPILETRHLYWPDVAACEATARALATRSAVHKATIELQGELGAGKTTFARHLLRALGATGRIKSPSYAVMEAYVLPGLDAWHFDYYRFDDANEWEEAGFRELYAQPGLKLSEWPQKVAGLLPEPDLHVHLEALDDDTRRATFTAHTDLGRELLP